MLEHKACIEKCPVCSSVKLIQLTKIDNNDTNLVIGGLPPRIYLDGCYCADCGSLNKYNVI